MNGGKLVSGFQSEISCPEHEEACEETFTPTPFRSVFLSYDHGHSWRHLPCLRIRTILAHLTNL